MMATIATNEQNQPNRSQHRSRETFSNIGRKTSTQAPSSLIEALNRKDALPTQSRLFLTSWNPDGALDSSRIFSDRVKKRFASRNALKCFHQNVHIREFDVSHACLTASHLLNSETRGASQKRKKTHSVRFCRTRHRHRTHTNERLAGPNRPKVQNRGGENRPSNLSKHETMPTDVTKDSEQNNL